MRIEEDQLQQPDIKTMETLLTDCTKRGSLAQVIKFIKEGVVPQQGVRQTASIKIKPEVDTMPPPGFDTEEKLPLKPFSFYVKCLSISDLFAEKMHALLFRKWKDNVKGCDWYDMEWYIRKGVTLNLEHFALHTKDNGDWEQENVSEAEFRELLNAKIDSVNFQRIKDDIRRFIPNASILDIWSLQYFHDPVSRLKVDSGR